LLLASLPAVFAKKPQRQAIMLRLCACRTRRGGATRARLVAALRRAVEPTVHAPEGVQSARVCGVSVVDKAVVEGERAHARPLAMVHGHVGPAHGRKLLLCSLPSGLTLAPPKSVGPCRGIPSVCHLAPVVVFDALMPLVLGEPDGEVEIEVVAGPDLSLVERVGARRVRAHDLRCATVSGLAEIGWAVALIDMSS